MADPALEALGRRAATRKGWKWLDGCRFRYAPALVWMRYESGEIFPEQRGHSVEIDFSDPPTMGCLLALVRKKWGARTCVRWVAAAGIWGVFSEHNTVLATGSTEAGALLNALEADRS